MDSWKLIGTIAGCVVLDFGVRFAWNIAKEQGRKEAYEEMEDQAYVAPGKDGDRVVIVVNGKKFYLNLEPVE